jgi:hypothetical protein
MSDIPDDFGLGCCLQCGHVARHKCARCLVVRYCSTDCQRANWATHKGSCKELRQGALIQVEDLVFDVTEQPPKVLIRPRAQGSKSASGAPIPLTPEQFASPLGQWPFGQQGGDTPPQPVVGVFRLGTSVELNVTAGEGEGYDSYIRDAPKLGGGRLVLASTKSVRDSMFACSVTVEEWRKEGGALWRVEDAVAVILERYRVKQPPSTRGIVWGSTGLGDFWAVNVKSGSPGQFCLFPHLYYHYTADITSENNNCVVM